MKIIAFYPGVYPNGFAPMSYRLHYYMKALQSKNVEVEIVMPCSSNREVGVFEGVPYRFVKTDVLNRFNKRKVQKQYDNICTKLASKCDVLFSTYYSKGLAKSVHGIGGKIAIEINENPYSIYASRLNNFLELYIKRFFFLNNTLKKFDGVITISHALADLIQKHKSQEASVVRIPILTGDKQIIRKNEKNTTPFILHAGALSEQKDGIKAMLKAFAIANKKMDGNLKFVFTIKKGFPSLLKWIEKFLIEQNLQDCVEFKGVVSKLELNKLYANCSLAIVNKPINAQNNYNFPTKLTELLPREIPVVLSKTGEINYFFKDKKNAFMVEPNHVEQIAQAIENIISNPTEAMQIAKEASLLAKKEFYYLTHAEDIYKFFKSIACTDCI